MKKLKLLIIILIALVVAIIATMIVVSVENNKNKGNNTITVNTTNTNTARNNMIDNNTIANNKNEVAPHLSFDTSLQRVTDISILGSITKNINKYFNYIKEGNTVAVNELGGNLAYTITGNVKYNLKQAISTENGYQTIYYTYGILTLANGDFTATEEEIYIVLYLDNEHQIYRLEKVTKDDMNNLKQLGEEEKINIIKGQYNTYEYENIDKVKYMESYLEDYSFQIFNNTRKAYALLNEEYRNKRFGTIDEFIKFLNEKQTELVNIKIEQYTTEGSDVYIGKDQYSNYYYIKENDYNDYEIILDDYTMQADYSNADTETKIKKNTEKFILMLNSADYTNAYNLLEPSFIQANFPTEQDFINYRKSNWFARNIIASKEVNEEGICVVTIKDSLTTQANILKKQFKVTLGEGMNFTIEFNI